MVLFRTLEQILHVFRGFSLLKTLSVVVYADKSLSGKIGTISKTFNMVLSELATFSKVTQGLKFAYFFDFFSPERVFLRDRSLFVAGLGGKP